MDLAAESDSDLLAEINIEEQKRLYSMFENSKSLGHAGLAGTTSAMSGTGPWKVYFYAGKPPHVFKEDYPDYASAFYAYNRKQGCSRILASGFDVKQSQAQNKKNKIGLRRIKDYMNTEK